MKIPNHKEGKEAIAVIADRFVILSAPFILNLSTLVEVLTAITKISKLV